MKQKQKSSFFPTLLILCALGIGGAAGYQHFIAKKPLADLFNFSDSGKKVAKKGKKAKKNVKKGEIPGSYIGNNLKAADWQDTTALRDRLSTELLTACKSNGRKQVKDFLSVPQNRLLAAQWMLAAADADSAETYAKFKADKEKDIESKTKEIEKLNTALEHAAGTQMEASLKLKKEKLEDAVKGQKLELRNPLTLAEVAADKEGAKMLEMVCNNLDWVQQITCTGENVMPGRAINILARIAKAHPDMVYDQLDRDTATAIAIEFARYGWDTKWAAERAAFYIKHNHDGRFNADWYKLPFFLRRVVCGWKGNHDSGSAEAQEYALTNIHLPNDRYTGACWQCGYKLYNVYGDSIHGSNYYEPFVDQYNHHFNKTYEVGGVCGGLSHYGASAAVANGVPALTTGEPGHCSFVVYVNGKWTPAYSLDWQRGLHWQPNTGVHVYSTLHAAEQLRSPEEAAKTRTSDAYRALAGSHAAKGETDKAIECYTLAESTQPLNYAAWREHAALLKSAKPTDSTEWRALNENLCDKLVPVYPEVAAEWARQNLYEGFGKAVTDINDRKRACALFWSKVNEMGVDRWRIEELAEAQMKMVYSGQKDVSNEDKIEFFRTILKSGISKEAYAPVLMAWGNTISEKMDEKSKQKMLAVCTEAFGGGKDMTEEQRTALLKQLITAAENMRDAKTFQTIAKMLPDNYKKPQKQQPKFDPFPGQLVSQGGVFFSCGTSRFDDILAHWGILEPGVGGTFHTNNVDKAWGAVRLPKHATLSGVVVVNTAGGQNWGRLKGIRVQVSETGKDDDWHDVGKPIEKVEGVMRFDLSAESPKALYVRIYRPDKEFFHFQGLFVYGKPAA